MPRAERELLFAGYPKLNLLVCSVNQDVLAFYEHLAMHWSFDYLLQVFDT